MKYNSYDRRKFLKCGALAMAGAAFAGPLRVFAENIKSIGYAGKSAQGDLEPWKFERKPLGDDDILVDIKYSSICHSDIHTIQGHWGGQPYPLVPGHEMAGIVTAVGKNVKRFKVGDKAGVGVVVDSCMKCDSCKSAEEQHCEAGMVGTYGSPDSSAPSGFTQGGYSNNMVVKEHFAFTIPDNIKLEHAAPLLCAGVTVYSPLIRFKVKKGDKVGVAGIGGLGHLAIKLAVAKGADVYAFTTTPSKADDIRRFGAKETVVVTGSESLKPWFGKMDFMISTIPYAYDLSSYVSCVKPYGHFSQVGVPVNGELSINNFSMISNRVHFSGSLVGGTAETQELVDYCAANSIYPEVQLIRPEQVNEAWKKVINKEVRYRYVMDTSVLKA
ncbi:MAG: NAD(P)-dependent alcohol dehydrogenase [Verrucomicrobia bacterium]|nr:MAG: NAD(P)-dependent alcohol dehydrogenase [Verrucomicrobiota bacterium]